MKAGSPVSRLGWFGGVLSGKGTVSGRGTEAGTCVFALEGLVHTCTMCAWVSMGKIRGGSYRTNQDGV